MLFQKLKVGIECLLDIEGFVNVDSVILVVFVCENLELEKIT